jgi:hypothetical protein
MDDRPHDNELWVDRMAVWSSSGFGPSGRSAETPMTDPAREQAKLRVLSLGAGVQSTTLALMAERGELPDKLDAAIFADTQWEPRAVYRHLEWLKREVRSFPIYTVTIGSIRDDILSRRRSSAGRYASIPWFILNPSGGKGKGQRQCSAEYKMTPIMWKLRELLGKGRRSRIAPGTIEQWIGISIDEASRMKPARQQWIANRWPLIEQNMSRNACLRWLHAHGYPTPPKSACIGCPFHNAALWRSMRVEAPEEFEDACKIDEALRQGNARGMRGLEFMHPSRIPLSEAVELPGSEQQPDLFVNECLGICGV